MSPASSGSSLGPSGSSSASASTTNSLAILARPFTNSPFLKASFSASSPIPITSQHSSQPPSAHQPSPSLTQKPVASSIRSKAPRPTNSGAAHPKPSTTASSSSIARAKRSATPVGSAACNSSTSRAANGASSPNIAAPKSPSTRGAHG